MTDVQMKMAAKEFAKAWAGRGDEKQETQTFWLTLLQKVLGVEDADKLNKKLRRFKSPGEYEAIEAAIFQELTLRTDSQGDLT